jgi:TonB family protein
MKKIIAIFFIFISLCSKGQVNINLTKELKITDSTVFINDCCWEIAPKFPGGDSSLSQFLAKNLIYPDSSKNMKIEGDVFVSFEVDTSGILINLKIIKGVNEEINKEVERVFSIMPIWISGMCGNGTKRRMQMTMPILFRL